MTGTTGEPASAVLDVGSNTIRLLVARLRNGQLERIFDRSEFVRLGLGVDTTGQLRPDREDAAVEAIERLADEARAAGVHDIVAIATSAVRDAANGASFARRVEASSGIPLEIVTGGREADLTYLGASIGLDVGRGALICDLGGGSTELICADRSGIRWETSEQIGSGRLTERYVHHDPPKPDELAAVDGFVTEVLDRLPPADADQIVFTGGTATHAAAMAGASGTIDRLVVGTLERMLDVAASRPADEIAATYRFQQERARVLPAGIATLRAIARHYEVDHVVITRNGIREGVLIDRFRSKGEDK
jgi:exopolyphosphatase/guanosine-5'-triphosphate,3'-diphosphate pyrophosphatase